MKKPIFAFVNVPKPTFIYFTNINVFNIRNVLFTGKAWAATLGIPNAKVYRISGMRKVDEYDIVEGEQVRKGKNDDTISKEILTE